MRTYDYPKRRFELLINVTTKGSGGSTKIVLNPTAFSISDLQTDRWKLVIPDTSAEYYVNSADIAVDDAEVVSSGDPWDSREYMDMDVEFNVWRETGSDFNLLVVAYVPTRSSS